MTESDELTHVFFCGAMRHNAGAPASVGRGILNEAVGALVHGSLFLDEIGEMNPALQVKLLRFLSASSLCSVGGEAELISRCRVVAAADRDVDALRVSGRVREDLEYRLAVVRFRVPPLRERASDILGLACFLPESIAKALWQLPRQLTPAAEVALAQH